MIKTTKQKGEFGMKRTVYEAPVTELFRVELEGNFCASADVDNPPVSDDIAGISDHTVNQDFNDFTDSFDGEWK